MKTVLIVVLGLFLAGLTTAALVPAHQAPAGMVWQSQEITLAPGKTLVNRVHPYTRHILVLRGAVTYTIAGLPQTLREGERFVLKAGVPHALRVPEGGPGVTFIAMGWNPVGEAFHVCAGP